MNTVPVNQTTRLLKHAHFVTINPVWLVFSTKTIVQPIFEKCRHKSVNQDYDIILCRLDQECVEVVFDL